MLTQVDLGLGIGAGEDQLGSQPPRHLIRVVLCNSGQAIGALQLGKKEAVELFSLQFIQGDTRLGQEAEQGVVKVAQ